MEKVGGGRLQDLLYISIHPSSVDVTLAKGLCLFFVQFYSSCLLLSYWLRGLFNVSCWTLPMPGIILYLCRLSVTEVPFRLLLCVSFHQCSRGFETDKSGLLSARRRGGCVLGTVKCATYSFCWGWWYEHLAFKILQFTCSVLWCIVVMVACVILTLLFSEVCGLGRWSVSELSFLCNRYCYQTLSCCFLLFNFAGIHSVLVKAGVCHSGHIVSAWASDFVFCLNVKVSWSASSIGRAV